MRRTTLPQPVLTISSQKAQIRGVTTLNPFQYRLGIWTRFGLGLCSLALATVLTGLFRSYAGDSLLFLPLAAVTINSLFLGFLIGAATSVLATVVHDYLFMDPPHSPFTVSTEDAILLGLFLLVAGFMSWIGALLRSANRKALEAVRAREDVIAIVSHDLKNPLSTIQLGAELLLRSSTVATAETPIRKSVENIRNAADRMRSLIGDILNLEKIKGGQVELEIASMPVDRIVAEAAESTAPLAEQRGVRLEAATPLPDAQVLCDPRGVSQIFSNLLGNAVKFTPRGREVSISVSLEEDRARFTVADQGGGIPQAQLPHLFERYWQAPATANKGTGLGLWIAGSLVSAQGGHIWAESEPGRGTRFHFTLPLASGRSSEK
jgi:signal transduction histidine kinase